MEIDWWNLLLASSVHARYANIYDQFKINWIRVMIIPSVPDATTRYKIQSIWDRTRTHGEMSLRLEMINKDYAALANTFTNNPSTKSTLVIGNSRAKHIQYIYPINTQEKTTWHNTAIS